jgi:hypothetical protein
MKQSEIIEKVREALDKYEALLSEINQKVSHKMPPSYITAMKHILIISWYRSGPIQN